MNPLAILVGLVLRTLPWAMVGAGGALVGSVAVQGARWADIPPVIPDLGDEDEVGEGTSPAWVIAVQPLELAVGAVAGPLLALLLRPRPLGAFLGGLAGGAVTAALIPSIGSSTIGVAEAAQGEPR